MNSLTVSCYKKTPNRRTVGSKGPQVFAQYVRVVLLHGASVHAATETEGTDRSPNSVDRDHVGSIFNLQCDKNLHMAFEIGAAAKEDGERGRR